MRKRLLSRAGCSAWVVLLLVPLSICRADNNKLLIEAGKKATALVEIRDGKAIKGWASAFCIDRSGVFVTNNHVATTGSRNNKLTLVLDSGTHTQRSLTATVLKSDPQTDLAIVRADHAGPYDALELSDPASIRALAETAQVTVFGFPLGEALAMQRDARPEASVELSRITALRHDHGELELIQLDGSINPGNSGGPVVDERGKVIGIVAAGIPGTAISFAIPANRVGHLLVAAHVTIRSSSPADAAAAFAAVLDDDDTADPASRASVPDDAGRKASRRVIRDLLAGEFADTTPKGKRALAAALLRRGQSTTDDPAGVYELLSEACDAAVDCGDLDTAVDAANELGRRYDINTPAQMASVITRVAPKLITPLDQTFAAAHGLLAAQGLVHRDMYADAQRLVPIVRDAAAASYSVPVQTQVRDKLARVESACAQYPPAKAAMDLLKTNPNDPQANLTAGRFQCFVRNDFDKGLPLLARGADPALKAAAAADLTKPSTGMGCKAAGDAWWDQAAREVKDPAAEEQCTARAGYWYRLGVVQLDGLAKTLVQQRLGSLPAPSAGRVAEAGPDRSFSIAPGSWSRKWTIKGADTRPELRIQTYTVFDGGARVKAFSWDLPFIRESDGSLSIEGTHFFQTFTKTGDGISVREWPVRADYLAGKEPLYIGVFEPIILDPPPTNPPGPAAGSPHDAPFDMSDWRVWCWSGKSWSEFPLDKMTVQRDGGTLKATNTTNSNWKRAILLYKSPVLNDDFDASVEYRGQIESFDLQSALGEDKHITCSATAAGDQWHAIKLQRTGKTVTASIDGTPVKVNYGKADASLAGFFCVKLQPNDTVELRNFTIQHSK